MADHRNPNSTSRWATFAVILMTAFLAAYSSTLHAEKPANEMEQGDRIGWMQGNWGGRR